MKIIFATHKTELTKDPAEKQRKAFESLKAVQTMHFIRGMLEKSPDALEKPLTLPEKVDSYYLALILPYIGYKYTQKGKKINVYEYIINDGLKVGIFLWEDFYKMAQIETECIYETGKSLLRKCGVDSKSCPRAFQYHFHRYLLWLRKHQKDTY